MNVLVTYVKHACQAWRVSMKGLYAVFVGEVSFQMECLLGFVLTCVTFFLPVSKTEKILMIMVLVIVLIVELLNSAIEVTIDRISREHHVLSGLAKDIGSAAVLVAMLLAIAVWLVILM